MSTIDVASRRLGLPRLPRSVRGILEKLHRLARLGLGSIGVAILCVCILLRPLVRIRFAALHVFRIGTLLCTTDYWLRRQELAERSRPKRRWPPTIDIFIAAPNITANDFAVELIGRRLTVLRSRLANSIHHASRELWWRCPARIDLSTYDVADHDAWRKGSHHIPRLDEADRRRGQELVRRLGIGDGDSFVCFFSRDAAYMETHPRTAFGPQSDPNHWRYHDYRNTPIDNYRLVASRFADRGTWMLRMGAVVEAPIAWDHPRIVDYATLHRSDFGDMYLMANCRFFIGDAAGIAAMAMVFDVPVALCNTVVLTVPTISRLTVFMPKKYRLVAENRLLTYREVIERRLDRFVLTSQFTQAGIEPVANTPEEILGLADELEARIAGAWAPATDDLALQDRFWSLFPADHPGPGTGARVGTEFLRRNRDLIA